MARSPALLAALLSVVLVAGCATSSPDAGDSSQAPEPSLSVSRTPSASPTASPSASSPTSGPTSSTPSASPTPPPLPRVGWRDGRYPVPCFDDTPMVRFENGRATYQGFQVTADVVARGELGTYESVSIHIVCSGASSSPSSVLVYIGAMAGPRYVGPALSPKEYIDLKRARYVDEELEIIGFGFTRRAPLCCPDLLVTKTVRLDHGELVTTALTKEPLES
jgi:hypothetical protein